MKFIITGWVEVESSNIFITMTNNWTHTWFCTHIFWHDSRFFIFWNKDTIVNFLKKIHCSTNVFDSRCTYFIFDNRNEIFVILPMYCWLPSMSDNASMQLQIDSVLLADICIKNILPSLESEVTAGCICILQKAK